MTGPSDIITVQSEAHWHQLRAQHIGSSDVAALFDASPYMTKFELWHRKAGTLPDSMEDTERMFWGRKLEAVIAQGVGEREGWEIIPNKHYFSYRKVKGLGCTPDFFVLCPRRGLGVMEVKNVDRLEYMERWDEGEPPLNYLLQLQEQLACTGYRWGAVVPLIGGNSYQTFEYLPHEASIRKIETAAAEFWASIAEGKEPPAVADDYEVVRRIFGRASNREIDLTGDNELPDLCAGAVEARNRRLAAEKDEKGAKTQILLKMGDAARAKVAGGFYLKNPEITQNLEEQPAQKRKFRRLTVCEPKEKAS